MQLYQIIYHSHSALPGADGPPIGDLGALLEKCLDANPANAITGVLAFHDDRFLQVIEGPEAAVDRLYAAIRRDRRHRGIELVRRAPCAGRRFARWSMALAYRDLRLVPVFAQLDARPAGEQALTAVAMLADIVA